MGNTKIVILQSESNEANEEEDFNITEEQEL